MKNESLEILQKPQSAMASFQEIQGPLVESIVDGKGGIASGPIFPTDAYQQNPSTENAAFGAVFVTILCSILGWILIYAREIFFAAGAAYLLVVSFAMSVLHVLQ